MKLIDKDALVAEIERLHKAHSGKYGCDEVALNLEYLEDFLDTLEVKEVDLEKEIEEHATNMPISEFVNDGDVEDYYEWARKELKYFFELGIKAREGGEK